MFAIAGQRIEAWEEVIVKDVNILTLSLTNAIGPNLLPTKNPQIICETSQSLVFPQTFFGAYFSLFDVENPHFVREWNFF